MNSIVRIAVTMLGAMALSACGGPESGASNGGAENSRILEGSVSDEMIPYEKLRSEPPAARIEEDEDLSGKSTGPATPSASSPSASAPEATAPEAAPASEPAAQPATDI
jgi:hypothetical protein